MLASKYFFTNPYPDYEFGFTFGTQITQLKTKMLSLVEVIFNKLNLDDDECDGGIYSGVGGVAYMFLHLCKFNPDANLILSAAERVKMAPIIQKFLNAQLMYYSRTRLASTDGDESQKVGFLVGEAGVFAVGAVLAKAIGNEGLQLQCVTEFVSAANIAKRKDFHKRGSDDLFYGRTGYLCGALWLNQYLGYQPVPVPDLFEIWQLIVQSGRETAKLKKCPYPLAYTFCNKQYIGAAHGLSSTLQILLSWPEFLEKDKSAEGDIRKTLDYFIRVVFQDYGNCYTVCTMDEIKNINPKNNSGPVKAAEQSFGAAYRSGLAQWCYGAPGFVYLFAKAGLHYKSHEYLKGCLKCADLVWTYGLIKKGPGLCHGIAGNGYVFLLLYRLTENDPKYLYRALRFAEFIFSREFQEEAETPDHPFSLFEGLAGAVCFLSDLIRPTSAEFPFFNVFYEPGLSTVPAMPLAIPSDASEIIAQLQSTVIPTEQKDDDEITFQNPSQFFEEEEITQYCPDQLLEVNMRVKDEPLFVNEDSSGFD